MKFSLTFTSIVVQVLLTSESVHSSSELELPGAAFTTQKYDNPNQTISTSGINPNCSAYLQSKISIPLEIYPTFLTSAEPLLPLIHPTGVVIVGNS